MAASLCFNALLSLSKPFNVSTALFVLMHSKLLDVDVRMLLLLVLLLEVSGRNSCCPSFSRGDDHLELVVDEEDDREEAEDLAVMDMAASHKRPRGPPSYCWKK
jgi:hypothetical protein